MRTVHFYCMAPKDGRYRVFVQERRNTVKISERDTGVSFPFNLAGWKAGMVHCLKMNISANAAAHAEAVASMTA